MGAGALSLSLSPRPFLSISLSQGSARSSWRISFWAASPPRSPLQPRHSSRGDAIDHRPGPLLHGRLRLPPGAPMSPDPVPAYPCTYFIDGKGQPTNVILYPRVEAMDEAAFSAALPKLIFPSPMREQTAGLRRLDGSTPDFVAPPMDAAPVAPPSTGPAVTTSNQEEIAEKIRRAKELLEKKKAAEEELKRKEELARETLRREEAKEMHKAAEERRNKELLEAAAARRKDKLESAKERERVKEQIRADKLEREARFRRQNPSQQASPTEESAQQQQKGIAAPLPVASDRCRIQLRFPDGSTSLHDFPAGDTLAALRQIVAADARVRGSPFRLAQPAPRRIYGEPDYEQTFLDLALTPSSTLMVLSDSFAPQQRRASSAAAGTAAAALQPVYSPMASLVNLVTYLIWTPLQYVLGLVGVGGGGGAAAAAAAAKKKKDEPAAAQPSTSAAGSSSSGADSTAAAAAAGAAARRRFGGGGAGGSGSRIHTLGGAASEEAERADDDPEASWNGNSTQFL